LYVKYLAKALDRLELPSQTPVVAVMAQCYAGSFANFIYREGTPARGVSPQLRCGFFATVKSRVSVGCTPEVDEAEYQDYSTSFFTGLSGYDRKRESVAPEDSADYNHDGRVSYAEAHAFAKVHEQTSDRPISTSEAWLQRRAEVLDTHVITRRPLRELMEKGRPEQGYVVKSLATRLGLDLDQSWDATHPDFVGDEDEDEEEAAAARARDYEERLRMELINIGMEERLRQTGGAEELAVLDRLLTCEQGSWDAPLNPVAVPPASQEESSHIP
jgi:hypothetical protein